MKQPRKKFIFIGLGAALLVLILYVALKPSNATPTVQTEKVSRRTITETVTAIGKIKPENYAAISPEVSGEVILLSVKEGDVVKPGQLLLRIKPDVYMAERDRQAAYVSSAKANLAQTKASMLRADQDYRRAKELFAKGLSSTQEIDASKTNYDVAVAQHEAARYNVEQAQASLKQANENLRKTTIIAPRAGTVSQLATRQGERVLGTIQMSGTNMMTIADLSSMAAEVAVDENDVVRVKVGDTARVEIDAFPGKKFTGVVYEIGNSAISKGLGTQEEVTNFAVKIRVLDHDIELRPGMSCNADIETSTHRDVLAVPIRAVTTRAARSGQAQSESTGAVAQSTPDQRKKTSEKPDECVFALKDGVAKLVKVKSGISDNSYMEITDGLSGSEDIIVGSYRAVSKELEDGTKVKVEEVKKKAGEKSEVNVEVK